MTPSKRPLKSCSGCGGGGRLSTRGSSRFGGTKVDVCDMAEISVPGRRLKGMPMMPLHQFPTAKETAKGIGFSSGLRNGRNLLAENFFEKLQHAFPAEILVRLVAMEIRLSHIFQIFGIVFVQLDDFFDDRFLIRKVGVIDEAFGI